MTPILSMSSDPKHGLTKQRHPAGPGERGAHEAVSASSLLGRHRHDRGAAAAGPAATRWGWRAVIVGALAWYLAVLGLLALLSRLDGRRASEVTAPADRPPPAAGPPEGPGRNQ
jgi:hypothetical protein